VFYAAGCISSWQVHLNQTGQMLRDRWSLTLPGGGGVKHDANNLPL
jgi:hypothetical protein